MASRNLPNVLVLEAQQVDPYSLLRYKKVVITKDAVAQLEEQWVMNQQRLTQVILAPIVSEKSNVIG